MQARRRASPAERVCAGVQPRGLHGAGQDGVVDGDDHGGGALGVQVVGGQVLEQLGEREPAAVPPVERPVRHGSWPGSRIRRGAVIASMTLPSIAAASAGTVKCPVVVPSPLSCSVSEHLLLRCLLLGADELVLVGVDDALVGFDGFDRSARDPTELVGAEPGRPSPPGSSPRPDAARRSLRSGSCPVACTITAACPGETSPASRAFGGGVVPGLQLGGQRDLSGRVRTGHGRWSWRARRRYR